MTAAPIAVYPLWWEADVLLTDGGVAHLRPSGPADGAAIRALHDRSSAKTLYLRRGSAGRQSVSASLSRSDPRKS